MTSPATDETSRLAGEIFDESARQIYRQTDRLFGGLLIFEWVAAIATALFLSPWTWIGTQNQVHIHLQAAVFLGGLIVSLPVVLSTLQPGRSINRHVIAVAQMLMSALLIHLTGGRIETHFHIFGSLAFLAFYRDWKVLITATVIVAADHLLRGLFWPLSVFGEANAEWWRWLEHAGWVVFEDIFLLWACFRGVEELQNSARRQASLSLLTAAQEQETRERQRQEERIRTILNSTADGIISLDSDGLIQEWNAAAARLFRQPADTRGLHLSEFLPELDWSRLLAPARLDSPATEAHHLTARRSDSSCFFAMLRFSRSGPDSDIWIATVQDVSHQRLIEEERRQIHGAIETAAAEISAVSEKLLLLTSQQHICSENQLQHVDETVSSVDEVTTSAHTAVIRCEEFSRSARQAETAGLAGRESLKKAVASMETMKADVDSVVRDIQQLVEQLESIGRIVDTVQDITEQTNVLALNAAIEAARAGEHGKGFTVLAQEVRGMAEESREAMTQIHQIIREIRGATAKTIHSAGQGRLTVSNTLETVQRTDGTINALVDFLEESIKVSRINQAAMSEHSAGMDQIRQAMARISLSNQECTDVILKTAQAARLLDQLSQRMDSLFSRRSLEESAPPESLSPARKRSLQPVSS